MAGKSYYRLTISNDTPQNVWVKLSGSGCTDWKKGDPNQQQKVKPNESVRYEFVRASRCSGENGQVPVTVWQSASTAPPSTASGSVLFNYTADHQARWTTVTPGDRSFRITFRPRAQGDNDDLVVGVTSLRQVNVATAISNGCRVKADTATAVEALSAFSDLGSLTKPAIDGYVPSDFLVSKLKVTAPVWGFRGLTFGPEVELEALKRGFLLSKMASYLSGKTAAQAAAGWAIMGPQSGGAFDSAAFALRALAVRASGSPRSQYVSVAVDFETAAGFGRDDYVYAFQLVPNSELFGLKACGFKGSEAQVQPFGGTAVYDLMRRKKTGSTAWTAWNGTDWVSSTVVPKNP
ncbi:MAG TPA: hypothetical protein VF650_02150 [Allosphingosinicella sp.]